MRRWWLRKPGSILALSLCLLLPLTLVPGACQEEDQGQEAERPGPDEIVVRVGDMAITQAELDQDFDFLKGADPSLSAGYIRYYVLTQVLIPGRLIRKALDPEVTAEVRKRAEELARAVRSAGGDLATLRRYGDPLGGKESPFPLFRTNDLEIAAARAAFDLEIGEVSGAIHGIWGSYVLSPTSVVPGVAGSAESRNVYTVFFPYSQESGFKSRILKEAERYTKLPLEVHSYYYRELRPSATDIRILPKD